MKLISIKLFNFRCFYQQTPEIVLARFDDRNITILHGNNGTGKTSLLNAFTWVLYEKFTSAFGDPEQLVNRQAIAESQLNQPVECWAEVLFEHDSKRYRVRRLTHAYYNGEKNIQYSKSELFLQVAGDDGRWVTQNYPEAVINGILPKSLHQYFFFDGERIEQIVRSDNRNEIAEATKKLLGVQVLDNAIKHLKEWSKSGLVMGPDSSTFPIVMDSPFGSLDEIYRRQVARLIPQLANQLVVMVSKTQWRVEVAEEMTPRVGKEYVFVFNSNKPDTQTDDIVLYGRSYPLVRRSAYDYEYTEVLEVNHG
jgi:DNA repair exonuclease SbcCD ATPase subunit